MNVPQFDDVVHDIYGVALSAELWPQTLDAVAALSGSKGAILYVKTPDGWTFPVHSPSVTPALEAYVEEGWESRNPWLQNRLEAGFRIGDVYRDFDVVTREEMDTNPFYTEFLRRFGLGRQMVAIIYSELGNPTCFVVHREMAKGPFGTDEMQTHLRIARHLEQSLRINTHLGQLSSENASLSEVFNTMKRPAFIVDGDLNLKKANKKASEVLGRFFVNGEGKLAPAASHETETLHSAVRRAHDFAGQEEGDPRPITLSSKDGDERIVVWSAPLVGHSADGLGLDAPGRHVLLLAQPLSDQQRIDPTVIRSVYALTTGEARLASVLAAGRTVKEAAIELGLAESTARLVLNRIFKKMGVHRQPDLVARILELGR
ncbi:helix-turn-helix transcriptional regulator [Acuticoccus sp. M5D2P5]|uniref:helix-turn-helix transcriptional regulator n=1 Tax=Acuticoccus kalidii TaxID=2910977 RepID=UPI001F3B83E9|nr:helix-turn-helix transcriptional regulator [Acuticoccus kalidii]MCF3932557.1 helix-turn-helix transcriptional regulator [Acuticoccus kalidii]